MKDPSIILCIIIGVLASCTGNIQVKENIHPNVLFIAVDDLNDWTGGLEGHPQAITPNLDRLMGSAVSFKNAHSNSPACQPSRASLLSGLHPTSTGWYNNNWNNADIKRTYDTLINRSVFLPQYFRQNGYKTMAAGKIYHKGVADLDEYIPLYWDEVDTAYRVEHELLERGLGYGGDDHHYHPFPKEGSAIVNKFGKIPGFSLSGGPLDAEDIPGMGMHDAYIADWGRLKLREDHDAPFLLALGFVRPHVPFTAPRDFFELYERDSIQLPQVSPDDMKDIPIIGKAMAYGILPNGDHQTVLDMGPDYWADLVHAYLASVSFVDAQIGKVLDALENSEYGNNTIIVLWSDHGQHLGEKKHWRKMALWEESTRVPMVIKLPNQPEPKVCAVPVSLLDIYPTLVDLCNLPKNQALEGNSLSPLLTEPDQPWDEPVVSCWFYGNYAVRDERWRYIRYSDGTEELYDHSTDPNEWFNLAGKPGLSFIKDRLEASIPKNPLPPFQDPDWAVNTPEQLAGRWKVTGVPEQWRK